MKHLKSIVLATLIATAAGTAQARDAFPVETHGRGGVAIDATRVVAPSAGGSVDAFGRGSSVVQAKGSASTLTATITDVSRVQGRS